MPICGWFAFRFQALSAEACASGFQGRTGCAGHTDGQDPDGDPCLLYAAEEHWLLEQNLGFRVNVSKQAKVSADKGVGICFPFFKN